VRALWLSLLLCLACPPAPARPHAYDRDEAPPGQFDYYLLSLSWSPAYCLIHPDDRPQCGTRGLGFILHGLWPQEDSGHYPERCSGEPQLSQEAVAVGATLYPSIQLMRHEWESHGTCSGLGAIEYFRTADRALAAVQIPAVFEAPRRSLRMSREEIAVAFRAANPAMPDGALALDCGRGQLSEVRICLTRGLALRSCGRGVRSSCPDGSILIQNSR
jgi:ribonuclease T2